MGVIFYQYCSNSGGSCGTILGRGLNFVIFGWKGVNLVNLVGKSRNLIIKSCIVGGGGVRNRARGVMEKSLFYAPPPFPYIFFYYYFTKRLQKCFIFKDQAQVKCKQKADQKEKFIYLKSAVHKYESELFKWNYLGFTIQLQYLLFLILITYIIYHLEIKSNIYKNIIA